MEEINNERQFLSFDKERVQQITLDQLMKTHRENDAYGRPMKGIYHYELINAALQACRDFGYNPEVYDLFAAQNRDAQSPGVALLPQVEEMMGKQAIEAHILRRVYANVRLTDFDDTENTTNLAIAFHQKGIQVGFGNMVKICHNQCMMNANLYAATYGGEDKKEVGEIVEVIRKWLYDARTLIEADRERIERMKNFVVSADDMLRCIGMMTALRVKADTRIPEIRENMVYPLNQSQISRFTEQMLLKYHQNERITVWDMYDVATNMYKPKDMDIPSILPQNISMVRFLNERYKV